jgi:hypothetical protein
MNKLKKLLLVFGLIFSSVNVLANCVGYFGSGGHCSTGPGGKIFSGPSGRYSNGPNNWRNPNY